VTKADYIIGGAVVIVW